MSFNLIYYIALIMFVLLLAILGWGAYTFNKPKQVAVKFLNLKLLIITLTVGIIGCIVAILPLAFKVWDFEPDYIKSDPTFLALLICEYILLVALLLLSYIFSFDFGIAIDDANVYFFGQSVKKNKIVALQRKKYVLKIVYEQGVKKMTKKLVIVTPKGQNFVDKHLQAVVQRNLETRVSEVTVADIESNVDSIDNNK